MDEITSKPWYKSVTIALGVAIAILPALIDFMNAGKFSTADVLAFVLGLLVILRRVFGEPAVLTK